MVTLGSVLVLATLIIQSTEATEYIYESSCASTSQENSHTEKNVGWLLDCARICSRINNCSAIFFDEEMKTCQVFIDPVNPNCSLIQTKDSNRYFQRQNIKIECLHGGNKTVDDECFCVDGYVGDKCQRLMEDCSEGFTSGFYDQAHSVFTIQPGSSAPFDVHCYMVDGMHTFIQKNSIWGNQPLESFNRSWQEYVDGFGDLNEGHWIGLQHIYEITNGRPQDLHITLHTFPSYSNASIVYENFQVQSNYQFTFTNTRFDTQWHLGDCLSSLRNTDFSTMDNTTANCVEQQNAGWWFNPDCSGCNPNGNIRKDRSNTGAFWSAFHASEKVIYTELTLVAR